MKAEDFFRQNISRIIVFLVVGILITILNLGSNYYGTIISKKNWETYTSIRSGLVDDHVSAIAIDSSDRVWFGTGNSSFTGGGVSVLDGEIWETYNTENSGLVHNTVNAIAIDSSERVWFGTDEGVSVFDGKDWETYTTQNSGLIHSHINAIAIDSADRVWFGTGLYNDGAVSVFDGDRWKNYTMQNSGLFDNVVQTIAIDSSDNVWFGTSDGVSFFDGARWKTYTSQNSGLVYNIVESIAIDSSDQIWFGSGVGGVNFFAEEMTIHGGVSVFDGENWETYRPENSGLVDYEVSTITIDSSGKVWFGGRTVSVFDGENWETYTPENSGLIRASVAIIVADNKGFMWIGGYNQGVNRVPIDEDLQINPIYTSIWNNFFNPKFSLWLNLFFVLIIGSVALIVIELQSKKKKQEPTSEIEQSYENKTQKRISTFLALGLGAAGGGISSFMGLYFTFTWDPQNVGLEIYGLMLVRIIFAVVGALLSVLLIGPLAGIVGQKVLKTPVAAFLFGLLASLIVNVLIIWFFSIV